MKAESSVKTTVTKGGRPITLDPVLPVEPLAIHPRRVESSIGCGFRSEWLTGDDGQGTSFDLSAGAGLGSAYLTLTVRMPDGSTRDEIVDIRDVVQDWVARVIDGPPTPEQA